MRVMVLGAAGMTGQDLLATAPPGVSLYRYTKADLDVTDECALEEAVRGRRPEVVVNATGYTRVDEAESNPDAAFAVNGPAVGAIGRAAAGVGACVVHYGSDYVFDGCASRPYREDDPPNPLGVYGASKLAGERALISSGARFLLIRTQWLFGIHGRSFPRVMLERAKSGARTRVVNDQVGRPTFTEDLARATWTLIGARAEGMVHVANTGTATWFDVARHVFQHLGAVALLEPCTTAEYGARAPRPPRSVLDTTRYEQLAGAALPTWEQGLDRFLELAS